MNRETILRRIDEAERKLTALRNIVTENDGPNFKRNADSISEAHTEVMDAGSELMESVLEAVKPTTAPAKGKGK